MGGAFAADVAAEITDVPQPIVATPLVVEVMTPPWAVEGSDGQYHLVHELRISNATPLIARLDRERVLDPKSDESIAGFDGNEIERRFEVGANRDDLTQRLSGVAFGVLFLPVVVASQADGPAAIVHDIDLTLGAGGKDEIQLTERVVRTPPLRGHHYIAGDGCCDTVGHVRALLPLNGQFRLAQRFAIDWEQIDDDNRIFAGDRDDVHGYHIYGKPVRAVADGKALIVRDGIPYVFEQFKMTGYDPLGTPNFDRGTSMGTPLAITPVYPPTLHRRQLPPDLSVVDWLKGNRRRVAAVD